jgi:hypothetical protein
MDDDVQQLLDLRLKMVFLGTAHAELIKRSALASSSGHVNGPWLLFDNNADPFQMNNLVDQSEAAKLQTQLDALLEARLKATADQFLPGDEYTRKWGYTVDKTGTVPYAP